MIDDKLTSMVEECLRLRGREAVEKSLSSLLELQQPAEAILTIIANSGVHPVPPQYLRGEVYSASYGNWDASSQEALEAEFKRILGELWRKLNERAWKQIYLIPTGHPALSIQIKLFVYRIMRINTIDLFYANGQYYELCIDHREIVFGQQAT
jgi:hypothetical protein